MAFFDESFYLNSKLAQLQANGETQYATAADVKAALLAHGFTAESHYAQYGLVERTSPNEWFNTNEYLLAKAAQLNAAQGVSTWTADSVAAAFAAAGYTDAYQHFIDWGWKEGVNPSNAFDLSTYLELKAAQSNLTVDELIAALEAAGLDPISHYEEWGQYEGFITDEAVLAVPADEQVLDTSSLTAALAKLAAANDAVDAFIRAYGTDVDGDLDVDADDIAQALTDADAAFDANAFSSVNYDIAATAAQKAAVIQIARDNAAANEQAARTAVQVAEADIDSTIATAAEIAAYEAAIAADAAAAAAFTAAQNALDDAELLFDLGSAVGLNATPATGAALVDWTGVTYNDDGDDGSTPEVDLIVESSTAGVFEVEETIVAAGTADGAGAVAVALLEGATTLLAAYQAAYDAKAAEIDAAADLGAATAALGTEAGDVDALIGARAAYVTAQAATATLEGLIADLADAEADVAALAALEGDVTAAELVIGLAGYDLNNGGVDFTADGGVDFAAGAGGDAAESELWTVDGLGAAVTLGAGDLISVSGYTYNSGALATAGNNSVLEFFITENAGVFSIVFENSVFGSNTVSQAETTAVTLTGVTALEDLLIGANYVQLA